MRFREKNAELFDIFTFDLNFRQFESGKVILTGKYDVIVFT